VLRRLTTSSGKQVFEIRDRRDDCTRDLAMRQRELWHQRGRREIVHTRFGVHQVGRHSARSSCCKRWRPNLPT